MDVEGDSLRRRESYSRGTHSLERLVELLRLIALRLLVSPNYCFNNRPLRVEYARHDRV